MDLMCVIVSVKQLTSTELIRNKIEGIVLVLQHLFRKLWSQKMPGLKYLLVLGKLKD